MAGKRKGTIVFSHANSFPAGTYRVLFEAWKKAGYTVLAVEKYGHDPKYPVTNHWPRLREQLVHFTEAHAKEPVFFVGHSLGGFLSLLAAARRPDLARGVVMLDSPVISGLLTPTIQFAKFTGLGMQFSPGAISRRRRDHWPSREAAHEHFAGKDSFARWDPRVLADYIACGIEDAKDPMPPGVTLAFRREVETDIYNTLAHDIPGFLRRHPLRHPLAFVGGTQSTEVRQVGMHATERLAHGRVSWIEGSHLFPFERPEDTSAEVLRWLKVLAEQASAVEA
ncbi:alpha/beta hydrolase [Rhizobacter sp. J219]|jgi:pimeloyl-ACP methyl ester carboxylesterase|uniref:alpha/beta fold hydrolase n=1 Tax=Rhizobacter sp. J219 TaxID=2898430 RepID=UPI002151DCDC|nr:alpha/beta hydrolase [Rhizobacter sp. J219]MCR5882819.1 alpha/beta hydrolase [Rhizobacter sp. J219]